jgi:hypothetical protein
VSDPLVVKTTTVNVVSCMPEVVLKRQEPTSSFQFVYSSAPVPADWHVIVDFCEVMSVPNKPERTMFVATEPPDVREYDLRVLKGYGGVLSAPFGYLRGLPNLAPASGVLPWRVGIDLEFGKLRVNLDRDSILLTEAPQEDILSVVTSEKANTRIQIMRLKLLDYLMKKMPDMEVFGRNFITVNDKAEILRRSRFHLALENCMENMFWTEKLSDPILMQNVTFYSGRNNWQNDFLGGNAIIEISLRDFRDTYQVIRRGLDSIDYKGTRDALMENKARVMSKLNFHHVVENFIRRQSVDDGCSPRDLMRFPKHMNSTGARIRKARRILGTSVTLI